MLFLWRRERRVSWRGGFEEIHFLLGIPGHLTLCQTSPCGWGKLLLQSTGNPREAGNQLWDALEKIL